MTNLLIKCFYYVDRFAISLWRYVQNGIQHFRNEDKLRLQFYSAFISV